MMETAEIQELEPFTGKLKVLKLQKVIKEIEEMVKNTPHFMGSLGGITQSVTESALNRLVDRILTNLEEFEHIL